MELQPLNVPESQYQDLDKLHYELNAIINDHRYQETGNDKQGYYEMMDAVHQLITQYSPEIYQAANMFQTKLHEVYTFKETPTDAYHEVMFLIHDISMMLAHYEAKLQAQREHK